MNIPLIRAFLPQEKFLLGLSGGVDSVAACLFLQKIGCDFECIHINNRLIPQDDFTAQRVKEFCEKIQIHLNLIVSSEVFRKGSKEDFARKDRIRGFNQVARERFLNSVVLAHHLDDCTTSYLWNALRGHANYWPIPPKTEFQNYTVFRPFLLTKKEAMKNYVQQRGYSDMVVEDEMNKDLTLSRNFLQTSVLPLIHSKKHFNLQRVTRKIILKKLKENPCGPCKPC